VADTQTGCAIAIAFDMVEDRHRPVVGARLRELVEREEHRLATGFLGTPVLLPALTATGNVDTAYRTLLQTDAPGWLYPVTVGATTIWERWDALQPDGTINEGSEMLSINHYALGAAVAWLYDTIGGIAPIEPGFARFRIAPKPGPGITSASVRFDSRHGRIESAWSTAPDGTAFELRVAVPPNTDAEIELPNGDAHTVGSGEHAWRCERSPAAEQSG
jgi:alpha-L-rhamnosidase